MSHALSASGKQSTLSNSIDTKKVYLNIYDLSIDGKSFSSKLGFGAFHSGVEVFGKEISFSIDAGIFVIEPKSCGLSLRESICFDYSLKTEFELKLHLLEICDKVYHKLTYDMLHHNCNNFTSDLVYFLTQKKTPNWLNKMVDFVKFIPSKFISADIDLEMENMKKLQQDHLTNTKNNFELSTGEMHSKEITAMHPALAEWLNEDQFFLEDITNVHIFVHFKNETAEIDSLVSLAELQESLGIEDNFAQVLGLLDLDETQLMTVQGNEKPDFPCFRPNQGRKELKKSQPLSSEVTDGDILSNDTNKKELEDNLIFEMPSVITNTTSNPTINAAKLRIRKPIQVDLQSACAEADLLGQDLFLDIPQNSPSAYMFANTAAPDKRSPQNSPSKFVPEDPFAEATQIREEPHRPRDKGKKSYFKKKSSFTKHTGPDIKKSDQEEDELTFKISNPKNGESFSVHSNELTSVVINKAFNLAFPTMDKSDIKDFKLHYCPKTEPGSIPIPMSNSKKTKGKQEQKESNIVDIDSSKMTYFSGYPLKSSEKLIATLDIGKGKYLTEFLLVNYSWYDVQFIDTNLLDLDELENNGYTVLSFKNETKEEVLSKIKSLKSRSNSITIAASPLSVRGPSIRDLKPVTSDDIAKRRYSIMLKEKKLAINLSNSSLAQEGSVSALYSSRSTSTRVLESSSLNWDSGERGGLSGSMKMDLTDDKPSLSHETEIAKDQPNSALPTSPHKEAFAKRDDNIQSDLRASVNLDRNASLLNLLKDIEETFSENPDSFRNISATFKLSPSIPTVPNDFVLKDACSENSYEALPAHSRSPSIADDSETAEILPTRNGDLNARESPIERSSSDEITWVKPIFRPNIDEDIKSLDIPSSSQDLNPKPQELLSISEKRKLIGKKKWNFADNDETKTPEKPNKTEKKISEETKPKKVSPESTKFSSKFSMKRPTSEPQIGTNYQKEEIPPLVFERRKSGGEKLPTPTKTSPHKDKSKK